MDSEGSDRKGTRNNLDEGTATELRQRFEHLRRVTRKESAPHMRDHKGLQLFPQVNEQFQGSYSKDQLTSLQKCFLMADHDSDGKLNGVELKYWLEKHNRPINQRDLKRILQLADLDGDGALSFEEFLLFCQKIQLKGTEDGGGGSIFDCFPKDTVTAPEDKEIPPKSLSFTQISPEVHHNVQYFEERIADELSGGSVKSKEREEAYQKRVQEIINNSQFSEMGEFLKEIRHPLDEIRQPVCPPQDNHLENYPGNFQNTQRFKTELFIVPENNRRRSSKGNSNDKRLSLTFQNGEVDDAEILLPINPNSSHKFDGLRNSLQFHRSSAGHDEGQSHSQGQRSNSEGQSHENEGQGPISSHKSHENEGRGQGSISEGQMSDSSPKSYENEYRDQRSTFESQRSGSTWADESVQVSNNTQRSNKSTDAQRKSHGSIDNGHHSFLIPPPELQEDFETLELNSPKGSAAWR